jgi:hypothetical protein
LIVDVVENDTAQDPMLEKRNRLLELKSQLVEIEKLIKERESELSSGSGSGSAMAKDTTSKDALPSDTINPIALSATSKPNETNLEDIDELEF